MVSSYKTECEVDGAKEITEILETKQKHKNCFTKIFLTNDILIQKKCLKRKNLFFPINQNKFIHIECNRLIVNKLENIRSKQKQLFQNEIKGFVEKCKKINLLMDCEKINSIINTFFQINGCNNRFKDSLICNICQKMIDIKYVEKHVIHCKSNSCNFVHVDGRKCETVGHKSSLHLNFLQKNELIEVSMEKKNNKFKKVFNTENLMRTSQIIVFKTRNIFVYLKHIVKNFSQKFDIVSKQCVCYKKIKNCQCLRYCLNNFDVDLFKKRKNKSLHYTRIDFDSKSKSTKYKIALIYVDKFNFDKKFSNFSFAESFRKTKYVKLIFLHNLDKF